MCRPLPADGACEEDPSWECPGWAPSATVGAVPPPSPPPYHVSAASPKPPPPPSPSSHAQRARAPPGGASHGASTIPAAETHGTTHVISNAITADVEKVDLRGNELAQMAGLALLVGLCAAAAMSMTRRWGKGLPRVRSAAGSDGSQSVAATRRGPKGKKGKARYASMSDMETAGGEEEEDLEEENEEEEMEADAEDEILGDDGPSLPPPQETQKKLSMGASVPPSSNYLDFD
jgi:hypothetical protein